MCDRFVCELCDYETKRSTDLNKHLSTKKHIKNMKENEKFFCKYCNQKFTQKSNLNRHERHICSMNTDKIESNKLIEELVNKKLAEQNQNLIKEFTEQSKNLVRQLAEENQNLAKGFCSQNDKLIDLATINAKSTKKSLSMMSYANKHLTKAQPLKLLEHKEAVKLLTYDKSSKHPLGTRIVYSYKEKILDEFLGDMIVEWYKKKNPDDQSIWSTDASRLSFILMNIFSETGKKEWNTDKKGLKIKKMIILPILEEIKKELMSSINEWTLDIDKSDDAKSCYENIIFAKDIILEITKDTIADDVLKYIAPEFGFNLSQSIKAIKDKCCKCNELSNDGHKLNDKYYCDTCLLKLIK